MGIIYADKIKKFLAFDKPELDFQIFNSVLPYVGQTYCLRLN